VCSLRGQDSKWFGYIQSLPRETVDIAIFWGVQDVIEPSSSVCSSRGCTAPSQSAVPCVAGNVATGSTMECSEHTPSLQLLDGRQARMCLGCTEAEKELSGLMVSCSSHRFYFLDMRFVACPDSVLLLFRWIYYPCGTIFLYRGWLRDDPCYYHGDVSTQRDLPYLHSHSTSVFRGAHLSILGASTLAD